MLNNNANKNIKNCIIRLITIISNKDKIYEIYNLIVNYGCVQYWNLLCNTLSYKVSKLKTKVNMISLNKGKTKVNHYNIATSIEKAIKCNDIIIIAMLKCYKIHCRFIRALLHIMPASVRIRPILSQILQCMYSKYSFPKWYTVWKHFNWASFEK